MNISGFFQWGSRVFSLGLGSARDTFISCPCVRGRINVENYRLMKISFAFYVTLIAAFVGKISTAHVLFLHVMWHIRREKKYDLHL